MQASLKGQLDQPPITQPSYQLCYLVNNNIGAERCMYLSQAQWNNLHLIGLCISCAIWQRRLLCE